MTWSEVPADDVSASVSLVLHLVAAAEEAMLTNTVWSRSQNPFSLRLTRKLGPRQP